MMQKSGASTRVACSRKASPAQAVSRPQASAVPRSASAASSSGRSASSSFVARAAPELLDLSEIAEDLDVNVSSGVAAPLATENGNIKLGMTS